MAITESKPVLDNIVVNGSWEIQVNYKIVPGLFIDR